MKRLLVRAGLAALLLVPRARAAAQDDQYFQVYSLIQEGDTMAGTQPGQALAKFVEAQSALRQFQKSYPDWNSKVVNFRLDYLANKIAETSAKIPASNAATQSATGIARANGPASNEIASPPPSDGAGSLGSQVGALQGQVRQLQSDIQLLEAKLREAFSAQPAAVDPREIAKTQERMIALEKENSLLKVSLAQQQARLLAGDTNLLERMQRDLAGAHRRLAEQNEKANVLALEKEALQSQLAELLPAATNAAATEAARKTTEQMNRQLMEQVGIAAQLASEKNALQVTVKALSADAEAATLLRTENEILKKQLAATRGSPAAGNAQDANLLLAQARTRISTLESDREVLLLEKVALENRVRQMQAAPTTTTVLPAAGRAEDQARITQLERERAELQKKLETAQRELYGRKNKGAAARIEELTGQLDVLRTRLGVMEAQRVPYSEGELALFKQPAATLSATVQKPARVLPPGTANMVAEARRDFASGQLDKAEQKYLQIVRQDGKNAYTLANLAAIQLQQNHLDDAEKSIHQATTLAPDDSYSLLIAGEVQFRRGNYEAALDALGRAAKLDSRNAEIQNYLGLTLSQKGMRGPAETALRKAIQLEPNYGSAHNNLAVIYATQRPPLVELARWHYEKALAAGLPKNPELEQMLEQAKRAEAGPAN